MNAEQNAEKAKQLLRHYFRLAFEKSNNTRWDSDNAAEVSDIVDHIINAWDSDNAPVQPDALTRIAVALERIADRLDGFSDNLAEDALR
jgi:hypothetical protein